MNDREIIDEFNEQKRDEELVERAEKEMQDGQDISVNDRVMPFSLAVASDDEKKMFTDTKEYPEDPFTDFETNTVNVQLASASFRYEVTDFILPGRNGFDLKIARRYDSNCANTRDMCTNRYNGNITTSSRDNRHDIGTYGLGYGWSFILPSIESIPTRVYEQEKRFKGADGYILHLEDGRSIKTNQYFTGFDDYKLTDIKIITESGNIEHPYNERPYKGTDAQVNVKKRYHKIIEYKNGARDYYRSCRQYLSSIDNLEVVPHYKLIARKDRFGNVICFDLTDYGEMTIVDTWGSELRLVKKEDKLTWSMPEGVQGNPVSYKILYTGTTNAKPDTLQSATNQLGQETKYEYYDKKQFTKKMKLGTDSVKYTTGTADRPYLLLKNIKYPNRASIHFEFDPNQNIEIKDDYDGYIYQFLLLSKSDKIEDEVNNTEDEVFNKVKYSYTAAKPSTYIKFADVVRHDNIKETHEFTKKGLLKSKKIQEKVQGEYVLVSNSAYEYNDNKLMTCAKDETYDRSTPSKSIQKETRWTYSSKAEISTETVTYKGDSASDQEINTTYDANYSIPIETTWKKGNVIIKETNQLDENKNQVVKCHQILEGEVLKEKTVYDYGSSDYEYCVIREKKYYTSGSGSLETSDNCVETAYTYDNEKCTHQCVSLSRTDIRDADDNLCSPIQEFFDYDKRGRVIKKTDAKGQSTIYQYDNAGRVIKEIQPSAFGEEVSVETEYNDAGNYITKTDAKRQKVRIEYTKLGQVSKVWLASSNAKSETDILLKNFEYNSWGELVKVHTYDGNGEGAGHIRRTEEFTYDSFGRIVNRFIPQAGYRERYEYDEVCADPEDVTKYYYREQMTIEGDDSVTQDVVSVVFKDQKGQVRKEYLGGVRTASYEYDNVGNNTRKLDVQNRAEQWTYDYAGRVVEAVHTDAGQQRLRTLSFGYDELGNQRYSIDEKKNRTDFRYDKAGRLIYTTAPFDHRNQETKHYYDAAGNVTRVKKKQEGGWQEVQHEYDNRNRLTDTYQHLGSGNWIRNRYQYDIMDRIIWMRMGDTPLRDGQQITRYTYDRFGNVVTMTDALGRTESSAYDKTGRLESKTDRNGNRIIYQYDALDRIVKESVQNKTADGLQKSEREHTYGKTGALIWEASLEALESQTSVYLETRYYYNEKGQLIRQDDPGNGKKHYTYDKSGNRQSFRLFRDGQNVPDIHLYYVYDDLNRLKQVRKEHAAGTVLAEYEYDDRGNRTALRYPQTNMETTYEYNKGDRITSMETKRHGNRISAWKYEYDVDGNLMAKTDTASSTPVTVSYRYDQLGRLTEEDNPKWKRVLYEYNSYSNRTSMKVEGRNGEELVSVTTYEYDLNNRLNKETRKEGKVTETWLYDYDENGNETMRSWEKRAPRGDYPGRASIAGIRRGDAPVYFEWRHYNGFNQLIRMNQDEREIAYQYRGDGMRHSSYIRNLSDWNGKTKVFYWDGANIVAEQTDGGSVRCYLRGINLIAREADNMVYYYVHNEHGDVAQFWQDGLCKGFYEYDAFGNEKNPNKDDENPFRYCGEYYDLCSSTYYLRARDYRPSIGRFLTEDPIRDGLNWYAYANNNPVMLYDPSGLASVNLIQYAGAMGATVSQYSQRSGFRNHDYATITYGDITQNYKLNNGTIDDTILNEQFGWENSWIPNGQTEAVYTGVHEVKAGIGTGNYHSSVIVFAAPGSSFYDTEHFEKNVYDGGHVQYATLGAGEKSNTLVSDINRKKDIQLDIKVQMISMNIYDEDTINTLFQLESYYNKNTSANYDLWPDANKTSGGYGKGYNSNSFISGLLGAAGITPIMPSYNVPGFDKPVPRSFFGI